VINKKVRRTTTVRTFFAIVVAATALGAAVLTGISETSASASPHGIVTLGATNEGGSGSSNGEATGILDILAAPCAVAVTQTTYEHLMARITLTRDAKVVARWEIFGKQRIAWVEPVGIYSIRSNQPTMTKSVRVVVTSSHVAEVRLIPACK
jgi:hypothetical protein